MASCRDCKNCIHYSLCNYEEICHYDIDNIKNAKDCSFFKDRSRFVELPCVGDKVYELCRINQFGDYKIVESEIRGFIVDTNGTAFGYELLGERFFLTHEEAEQALKERGYK